MHGETVKFIR